MIWIGSFKLYRWPPPTGHWSFQEAPVTRFSRLMLLPNLWKMCPKKIQNQVLRSSKDYLTTGEILEVDFPPVEARPFEIRPLPVQMMIFDLGDVGVAPSLRLFFVFSKVFFFNFVRIPKKTKNSPTLMILGARDSHSNPFPSTWLRQNTGRRRLL